jgi:hypothetical protein
MRKEKILNKQNTYTSSGKFVKPHIMPNFKIALHNLEQLNWKSGATQ